MKRIALLLAALLMFSLTGCGSSEAAGEASDSDKAGAYEVIPPEDGRGDLIPASSDVVSIPVLVGGGLPFTSMENLMNENYEDGTYTYEDMTQDGPVPRRCLQAPYLSLLLPGSGDRGHPGHGQGPRSHRPAHRLRADERGPHPGV